MATLDVEPNGMGNPPGELGRQPEGSQTRPTAKPPAQGYSFYRKESVGDHRTPDLADRDMHVLLERLQINVVPPKDSEDHALIRRFCTDVTVNIAWYAGKLDGERMLQTFWTVAAVVLGIAVLALTIVPTLRYGSIHRDPGGQIIAAQIGVLGAGALGTLQMLSSVVDVKARVGAFWKASADLKELLFTFEDRWKGRAAGQDAKLTNDFKMAVLEAVQQARRISREERDAFFGSYRSPAEVLSTVGSVMDVVRGRRQEVGALQRDALAARTAMQDAFDSGVRALRERMLDARAAVAGAEERVSALANSPEEPAAKAALAQARADLKGAEERLRLQLELHPGVT
jgi:hypothetical protein